MRSYIFVGDWNGDIVSAKEAGCGFVVAVLSGGFKGEILRRERPDLILPSVARVQEFLP